MKTTKLHCRDIFTLSNHEITKLVDFIFDDTNLDRLAQHLYQERPSLSRACNYRKIEVLSSYYDWAFVIKVTYGFDELNRMVTTGFLLGMEGGPGDEYLYERDVYLQSVAGFFQTMEGIIWEKSVADDFSIEVDFSAFFVYLRKLNYFLSNTLKIWSNQLTEDEYEWNPQLKDMFKENPTRNFIVQEITVPEVIES